MRQIGVGIIGFGRIGNEHAGWLRSAAGVRAVAASDPTPARREMAAERCGLRGYAQIEQMLADPEVDAVLVSTPTAFHFEHAMRAIQTGKHVMIEKPMALDLAQAQELLAASERTSVVLSVFHNRRWDIDYLTVKHAIDSGLFGKIINIESRLGQWASCVGPAAREWRPGWRNEAAFGGGALYDWGSHFIDQMWRLMLPAKPTRVFAQMRGNVWTRDCDDFARVVIDFDNGAVGMVEINTTTTKPLPRWHVDGTLGSAQSPYSLTLDTRVWAKVGYTPAEPKPADSIRGLAGQTTPPALSETQIWEAFARAMRGEGEPAVTARSVLPTMALLDAARHSAKTGTAVTPLLVNWDMS
jgi:predicted dehydrogenase